MSDNSLDDRSQGLIDRGSSLISSSTLSTASSLPVKNYFNSEKQSSVKAKEKSVTQTEQIPFQVSGGEPLSPEGDILYQWRLRRRLEEARREAQLVSEQAKQFQPQLPPPPIHAILPRHRHLSCDIVHCDTCGRQPVNQVHPGTGLANGFIAPVLHQQPASGNEDNDRESDRDTGGRVLTKLVGVCSVEDGIPKSLEMPCIRMRDQVVQTDQSLTAEMQEVIHKEEDQSLPLHPRGAKFSSPPSEAEEGATVNHSVDPETTLTSVTQLDETASGGEGAHNPDHREGDCGGGQGAGESSYWTITPCGSPESGVPQSIEPLLNEV